MGIRLLHVGLGPLGCRLLADQARRGPGSLVGVVDTSPLVAGRRVGEFVRGVPPTLCVSDDLESVLESTSVDVATLTTRSDLPSCAPTLRVLLERGVSTVSTCEELLWPWLRHPDLAEELDGLARSSGAALLGTGVNPGFLMDALPVFISAAALEVRGVHCWRIQDAAHRREPFQRKIGAGATPEEFARRVDDRSLRHVGLGESLHFLAAALGHRLERWEEEIVPVLAERELECALGRIAAGRVAGVRQVARGWVHGEPRFVLEFQASIGQAGPHDRVRLDSDPPLDVRLEGGVHGDRATSAMVLNCLGPLLDATPGLHTMSSIRMPRCELAAWAPERA